MNIKKVKVTEVGPRDGFQSEKTILNTEDKIDVINNLIDAGFPRIEVSSFVSPKAIPQLADAATILENVKDSIQKNLNIFNQMTREEIFEQRKSKFLKIGRDKGFMNNSTELSSLNENKDNNVNNLLSNLKGSKKIQIGLGVLVISVIIALAFIL